MTQTDEQFDDSFGARYGISKDEQFTMIRVIQDDMIRSDNYAQVIDKYFPMLNGEMRFKIAVFAMLFTIDQTGGHDAFYK
jgi:hypothetical protein